MINKSIPLKIRLHDVVSGPISTRNILMKFSKVKIMQSSAIKN